MGQSLVLDVRTCGHFGGEARVSSKISWQETANCFGIRMLAEFIVSFAVQNGQQRALDMIQWLIHRPTDHQKHADVSVALEDTSSNPHDMAEPYVGNSTGSGSGKLVAGARFGLDLQGGDDAAEQMKLVAGGRLGLCLPTIARGIPLSVKRGSQAAALTK